MSNQNNSKVCEVSKVLIFACSGAADVGEISDLAARELTKTKKGNMFCLAGIGGNISPIISKTKSAQKLLVIDGCELDCAKKTLMEKGITNLLPMRITNYGMEKSKSPATKERITKIVNKAEDLLLH